MRTRLLLDTCAVIWTVEGEPIEAEAEEAINRSTVQDEKVLVSPITAWERGMLISKGRLISPMHPKLWFARLMSRPEVELAELTADILTDASYLPGPIHSDPADRIIIATARALDLTIVTRDRVILDYGRAGHVRVLAC
jgi:PIN domain nuclease of toxin-antitoxin system